MNENSGYQPEREHPANKLTDQAIADLRGTNHDPRLERLRRIYGDGNDGALFEALALCRAEHIGVPDWALQEAMSLVMDNLVGGIGRDRPKGRNAKWTSRYKSDLWDLVRYNAVLAGRAEGEEWVDVYAWVCDRLKLKDRERHAVESAYKRVAQRMRENPDRYTVFKHISPPAFFRNSGFS